VHYRIGAKQTQTQTVQTITAKGSIHLHDAVFSRLEKMLFDTTRHCYVDPELRAKRRDEDESAQEQFEFSEKDGRSLVRFNSCI
jgi:hypothetical protein